VRERGNLVTRRLCAVLAALAVMLLPGAREVNAQAYLCANGRPQACVYPNNNISGTPVRFDRLGLSNKLYEKMNNDGQSVINNTSYSLVLYDQRDGIGKLVCIPGGGYMTNLDAEDANKASSTKLRDRPC
jgi:hypothetical protein